MEQEGENKWLCGLKYAIELGFTHAQFKEAIKRIKMPDVTDANQLLVALIDVSQRDGSTTTINTSVAASSDTNIIVTNSAGTFGAFNHQGAADVTRAEFATSTSIVPPNITNTITVTSPSAPSQDNNSPLPMSASTSCYSSIASFTSSLSTGQSFECLQQQQQPVPALRKVYIDGSNVARTHGKDAVFSWFGIKLCVDWFSSRQHRVKVFVPHDKCQQADEFILRHLNNLDALVQTPHGCNDDLFIIEAARHNNGVIVSNDLYRDEKRFNEELQHFIHLHRLPYVFVDDLFIPANDPRGRTGPTLEEFLKDVPEQAHNRSIYGHHSKLSRTKSHQKYQRNSCAIMKQLPNYINAYNSNGHRGLQSTRSLPMEPPCRNIIVANDDNQHSPISNRHCHQSQNNHHYFHNQQQHQDYRKTYVNHSGFINQRQPIGRATSMASASPSNSTRDSDNQLIGRGQVGGRPALCRTKSHNI